MVSLVSLFPAAIGDGAAVGAPGTGGIVTGVSVVVWPIFWWQESMPGSRLRILPHILNLLCSPIPQRVEHSDHSDHMKSFGRGQGFSLQGKCFSPFISTPFSISGAQSLPPP